MEMESNLAKGYVTAYKLASEELAARDPATICQKAAVSFSNDEGVFIFKYLGREYKIGSKTGEVSCVDHEDAVTSSVKVLLLHYLLSASDRPLSGRLVSFRDLKNGAAIYYPNFYKRAIIPLIKTFGSCIENLYKAAYKIEGKKEKYGHASVTINVFPMVPVTYVLWEGEDEIQPSGTILFDESVEYFLPAEDIVCAGSFGVYELMRIDGELK